jgi:predicted O-methyltransferase YrrM
MAAAAAAATATVSEPSPFNSLGVWWTNDQNKGNWLKHLSLDHDRPIHSLEIGSFLGGTARFIARCYMKHPESTLTCVDTWQGSPEHADSQDMLRALEKTFDENTAHIKGLCKLKGSSIHIVPTLTDSFYDIVYVDGHHSARFVVCDGIQALRKARVGGYVIFDDYLWGSDPVESPKIAIDFILSAFGKFISVIDMGSQVIVKKVSEIDF